MNILMFSWRGPGHPNFGGAEIATHEHAKAWVKAGHSVTLFTSSVPNLLQRETIDGVEIIRKGNQLISVQLHALFWYLFNNHPKYDLVVDQFHGIPFFTPLFVRTKKMAFIHEVAKEVWWTNHLSFPARYILGCLGYLFEPLIFLFYRNTPFLTVSQSTKNDLINWSIPSSNIHIVQNGKTTLFVKYDKEKTPTLIFLGAIAKDKGIEDALAAFSLILTSNPHWQLWVVGKGERKYLESLIIPENVKFWGFVEEQKKFELLAKAHLMINPSRREGWGLVNIEANSVGTPVVAYDVAGCRDSIKNGVTGYLCPKSNVPCLAETCVQLIRDDKLYERISGQALAWSKTFSWDKSTLESLNLLHKINLH